MKYTKILIGICVIIVTAWFFYLVVYPKINTRKIVEIPDVSNLSLLEAKEKLSQKKLNYRIIEIEQSEEVFVLYTSPEAGSSVKTKSVVTLYITKQEEVFLDDYTNMVYEEVSDELADFCRINNINLEIQEVINNELPENIIISQSQQPFTKIADTNLVLKVVKHNNSLIIPDLTGDEVTEISKMFYEYDLNVNYVYEYSFEPFGTIIGQSIKPNTKVLKGNQNEFIIYVSKGFTDVSTFKGMDLELAIFYLNKIDFEIIYVESNEVANKVIDIDKNLYYDNSMTLYLRVTK